MKRIVSLILAFTLCLGLNLTAFAAEPVTEIAAEATFIEDGVEERVVLTEDERIAFMESIEEELSEDSVSPLIDTPIIFTPGANVSQIAGYPLLYDITGKELFYYSHIGLTVKYNLMGQFMAMNVTAAQAQTVYNQALTYLSNNIPSPGHSYTIVGWYMQAIVKMSADNPNYYEYRVAEDNSFESPSEYQKYKVTSQSDTYLIDGPCQFPSDASSTNLYFIDGLEGNFYYRNYKNTLLHIPFRASIRVNVSE